MTGYALKRTKTAKGQTKVMRMPKGIKQPRKLSKYKSSVSKTPERKYSDTAVSDVLTSTGAATNLIAIAQGQDNTDRIGRKICVRSGQFSIM